MQLRRVVPGIETVGNGVGEVSLSRQVRPNGKAVARAVVIFTALSIMCAQGEKDRRGRADLPEIVTLCQILFGSLVAATVLVGHEKVAEIDVEIRLVRPDIGQRLAINIGAGVFVEVRIGSQRKGEAAAGRSRGVKSVFRTVENCTSPASRQRN